MKVGSINLSLSITVLLVNRLVSETHASLGIDIQTSLSAPSGKSIRLDIDFLDIVPFTLELIKEVLSLLEPFIISGG